MTHYALIQEQHLSVNGARMCAKYWRPASGGGGGGGGKGGLPRNSNARITDRPDMTPAVDCGRKTRTQPTNQHYVLITKGIHQLIITKSDSMRKDNGFVTGL